MLVYKNNNVKDFELHREFIFGDFGIGEWYELGFILKSQKNKVVPDMLRSLSNMYAKLKEISKSLNIDVLISLPLQDTSLPKQKKRKTMELESETYIVSLHYNRVQLKGVKFIENIVIEEPEFSELPARLFNLSLRRKTHHSPRRNSMNEVPEPKKKVMGSVAALNNSDTLEDSSPSEHEAFVVPRDGIFEIDLSNSNTNDSFMYFVSKRAKLNLDSDLLWHCRLGHISKKRIKKLQHDGLLNSTDLRAFEKSVTRQVERAKDLVGLIHTDGYEALVKRDTLTKPDKLEPRSIKCIFVGYPKETMGYSFYYPLENKVLVARNAEFLKNSLITQESIRSLEDLKIIQEEDTHPSINTSLHHEEDDLEIDEPQSDIIPIRRSTRTRHALDCMCLYIDAEEHELGDLGEPANYKAALLDLESDKWLSAINMEMQSMKDNEV
ncbi:zinc finger, CCHC-type containing protein [Tanacetum coccineum]